MKTLITRCAKSLLAMATGLALATNVQAAEDWFNVNFAEATADTWLDESAEGASWSDNAAEVATFVAGDENHLAIATGDDELQIQADDTLSLADATPTVNAKVAFTAFDLEDLPAVAEDAKAGLTMVQKSDESYAVYGIAKVGDVNDWVELTEITDVEPGTYDVSITLQYTADGTQVIYDFDGTSTDPMPIIAEEAGVLAIKGKGELYSVAAEYEEVTYEAELNGVRYSTFSAAYAAAENGDAIKLLANVGEFTPPATIALKAVTVDENGYDFTVDVSDQTQYAAKGFKLAYNDGTFGVVMPFEGDGSDTTPYLIASADDMVLFKNGVNAQSYAYAGSAKKYFQLTANISLTAWEGINDFYGVFDGDSNSITVQLKSTESNTYRGIFNTIVGASADDKAEIKSLVAIYNGWDTTMTGDYGCAPFAGKVSNTLFEDCVSGIAGDTAIDVTHNAAGFAVKVQDAGETIFDSCVNYTEVQTSANKAGGFVAIVEDTITEGTVISGNLKFVNCSNLAAVSSTTTKTNGGIGGFVAYGGIRYNFEFAGCVSAGAVSAPNAPSVVGAFLGNMNVTSTAADVSDDSPLMMASKVRAIGNKESTSAAKFLEEISNFKFAVVDNDEYYLVADEEVAAGDDTWVVVAPTITTWDVELAADESIAFDNELNTGFAANVTTQVKDYKIATDTKGTVTTYTCVPDVTYAFQIGSDKYETFAEAIDAATDGDTITMLGNFTGAGVVIPENMFATEGLTIDLGNFTFTGNEAVGSTGTKNQVIQILKGNKVTIKNGVITIDETMGESFRMIVQNYSDLTLTGVTLDGTKLAMAGRNDTYTFSNNSGTIVVDGDSQILASTVDNDQAKFAMDTCKYASYAVPTVTLGAATLTGDVELGGGSLVIDGATVNGELVATDATADGQVTLKSGTVPAPEGWRWQDAADGKVLVKIAYAFQIGSDKYETFAEAIAAATDGDTITMLGNFTGAGVVIPENMFATEGLTINLGGFVFTCNEAVGSTGTKNQAMQILKSNKVTISGGTITIDSEMGAAFRMIVQNYADLTLDGAILDGSNLAMAGRNETYTLSNNSGAVAIDGDSRIIASTVDNTQKKFAMDTCKYASYAVPTVTLGAAVLTGDVELGGGSLVIDGATISGVLVTTADTADGQVTLKSGEVAAPEGWKWQDAPEGGKVLVKDAAPVVVPGGSPVVVEAQSATEAEQAVTVKADRPAEVTDAIISAEDYNKYFKAKAYDIGDGKFNVFAEMDEEAVKPADTEKEIANNLSNLVLDDGKLEVSGKPGLYYYVEETSVLNDSEKPFVANEAGLADVDGKVKIPMTKFEGAGFYKLGVRTTATPVVE